MNEIDQKYIYNGSKFICVYAKENWITWSFANIYEVIQVGRGICLTTDTEIHPGEKYVKLPRLEEHTVGNPDAELVQFLPMDTISKEQLFKFKLSHDINDLL